MRLKFSKFILVLLPIILTVFFNCNSTQIEIENQELTRYVNPFIGTDGPGNTYPGAALPFGMIQLSPDIGIEGWDRIAGYFYPDSILTGFSHLHLSGTGAGDLYDILVMPTNSRFNERISANNSKPFSHFSHEKEKASPGYYSVELLDYGILAELTTTKRVGFQRYTFPEDSSSQINVDLGYSMNWDQPTDTYLHVVNDSTIEGYRKSTGWAKNQTVFFVQTFSKPFKKYDLFQEGKIKKADFVQSKNTKIILHYSTSEKEKIVVKTAISSANLEGAYLAYKTEGKNKRFDEVRKEANLIWEKQLEKIKIKSDDENVKSVFYTMMYQSMLAPTLYSDLNGNYKGANQKIEKAEGFDRYDTFSLWDTYRAAHPLYTIIQPEFVEDFVESFLAHYKETGLLPVWSMQGNETNMMLGYHAVPIIVDAYFKGFNFNVELAYEACKASATTSTRNIEEFGKLGFVPASGTNEDWSVSKTLEYAYDDWCIAMLANALGKKKDYEYFLKRSNYWKNIYDPVTGFFRPKDRNGNFIPEFKSKEYSVYYSESNAWQYFWSVQQDIPGLIQEMGGEKRFTEKLDSMFSFDATSEDKLPIFSTGMIGQYAHGNEPSHHIAYLYDYTDSAFKGQKIIRRVLKDLYRNEPNGHCGNEDCGQMSSWYIFSSLGFYPVNPAQGTYLLGSPLFERSEIEVGNGKKFTIEAANFSPTNSYIQDVYLNGEKLDRIFITHKEILNGGELKFVMTNQKVKRKWKTPEPNKIYSFK